LEGQWNVCFGACELRKRYQEPYHHEARTTRGGGAKRNEGPGPEERGGKVTPCDLGLSGGENPAKIKSRGGMPGESKGSKTLLQR